MLRQALGLVLLVAIATCAVVSDAESNKSKERPTLLDAFKSGSQAQDADVNKNGLIEQDEFTRSLFLFADADTDDTVTSAEFLDAYRILYKQDSSFPRDDNTRALAILFQLLDNLAVIAKRMSVSCPPVNIFSKIDDDFGNCGDGVLHSDEIDVATFTGTQNPTVAEYQHALEAWAYATSTKLFKRQTTPVKIDKSDNVDFNFDLLLTRMDPEGDDDITTTDFMTEFRKIDSSGKVKRTDFVKYMHDNYNVDKMVAGVLFGHMDVNVDLIINLSDVQMFLYIVDTNKDKKSTKQEVYILMQMEHVMIRQALGMPVKPINYDCPEPKREASENTEDNIYVNIMAMDIDNNTDGIITNEEMKYFVMRNIDKNADEKIDRVEFVQYHNERYNYETSVADLQFDAKDKNGDGVLEWDEYRNYYFLVSDSESMCICKYRLMVLASAQVAERQVADKKAKMEQIRQNHLLQLNEALKEGTTPAAENWEAMNGCNAAEGCNDCYVWDNLDAE